MSRIGKQPVPVPAGVIVEIVGARITVQGPRGSLVRDLPKAIKVALSSGALTFERANEELETRSMHGLARTLVRNMVVGVTQGYTKTLEITGVGYKAEDKKPYLVFSLGYSHPIYYEVPVGILVKLDSATKVTLSGADRQLVGSAAATIRSLRAPEPYKGKGVKYSDEKIRRKEGKSGGKK